MSINYLRNQGGAVIIGGGTQLADQAGNSGKYLTTDGTVTSWSTVTSVGTLSGLSLSGNLVATTSLSFKGADSSGSTLTVIGGSGSTAYSGAPGGGVTISGGTGNIFYDGIGGGNVTIAGGANQGGTGGSTGGSVFINGGAAPVGGAIVLSTAPSVTLIERFRILANGAWSIGTGGTSYGASGQVLTSNGNAAPSWQWSASASTNIAGGAAKQIPFQSAANTTAFSSNFTIDAASGTLSVYNGGSGTVATLILGSNTFGEHRITTGVDDAGSTQSLRIQPHRQEMGNGLRGGTLTLCGGDVSGASGFGLAGGVNIIGGGGSSIGGGSGLYGPNGPVNITGGPGSGTYPNGGSVTISGGTGNYAAGSVLINGGSGSAGGGTVSISTAPTSSLVQRLKILANGAWSVGSDDASYGTSGQVLTSNGNAAPSWQTVGGGGGGSFAGGAISSGIINGTDSTTGSSLTVRGGNGSAGTGGNLNLYAGTGTSTPGSVIVQTASGAGLPLVTRMTFSGSTGEIQFNSAYNESISATTASSTTTINCSLGNNFDITMSTSVSSLLFTNIPAARRMYFCTLILIQDAAGSRTITWPASIRWQGGGEPVLTAAPNKIDMVTLVTYDGGASWLGVIAGQNF